MINNHAVEVIASEFISLNANLIADVDVRIIADDYGFSGFWNDEHTKQVKVLINQLKEQ